LWLRDGHKVKLDAHALTVILKLLGLKVGVVIGDNAIGHSKAKYYRLDEVDCCC
jgi:hypothetical protein